MLYKIIYFGAKFVKLKPLYKLASTAFLIISLFSAGITIAQAKDKGSKGQAILVETAPAQLQTFKNQITVTGTLRASQGIVIRPEVAGKIAQIYFKSGTMVSAGTPLVQLNQDVISTQLQQYQSDLQLAQQNYARMRELYKTHTIARVDFDTVASKLTTATAKVAEFKAQLDQTLIKAPFAGKLGLSSISLGDYVKIGQDIVSLEAIDPIEVEFDVPQVHLNDLSVGQNITITSDAYAGQKFVGKIYATDAQINLGNRTIAVRATIPNTAGTLLPGAFVEVQLDFTSKTLTLIIPQVAVIYDAGQTFAFKVVGDKVVKTKVTLGSRDKENVTVLSGLIANDMVVTAGQLNIEDGSIIKLANSKK